MTPVATNLRTSATSPFNAAWYSFITTNSSLDNLRSPPIANPDHSARSMPFASENPLAPTATASHPTSPITIKRILIQGTLVEPKRQGFPRSHLLFDLTSHGKPYLRGEGSPYIY